MKVQTISRFIAVLLLAGLVSACSTAGRTQIRLANPQPIVAGKSVSLVVRASGANRSEAHKDATDRVYEELSTRLVSENIFGSVVGSSELADYRMDVRVKGARETSGGKRFWFGFMAPRSNIQVAVDLRSRAPEKLVRSFDATGYGAKSWLSPKGYGLDDPLREVIEQIMLALRDEYVATP